MRLSLRLFAAILMLGAILAAGKWAQAQAPQPPAPTIVSGSDVGFRVDPDWTRRKGKLTGTWVVRINGQWVEPESAPTTKSLTAR